MVNTRGNSIGNAIALPINNLITYKYKVTFKLKYQRTNDDSNDLDPTLEELEQYVANSEIIPQNPEYHIDNICGDVVYIGNMSFEFTCESSESADDVADRLKGQSLADGAWESSPGNGSFVYPTRTDNPDDAEELGVLSFESVIAQLIN